MAESLTGKLIADKYRIETLLREGGEGDLYAGRHEVMDKPVTIKVLPRALGVDARWTKRFVDEARTASAVTQRNVLSLTDFGTDAKGISYAVFEPVPSTTLSDILTGGPSMDEKRALDIAAQIASGVAAAHAKKVVHGRLNPDDIYVNTTEDVGDKVKVYGFGSDPMGVPQDADPHYLAPEQLTAFPVADERTDVYAVGIMFYEMLGGVVPYEAATGPDIQKSQENEPPPPLSAFRKDLNPEIEPIVLSAIAVAPERRYQTMAAFAEDLELLSTRLGAPKAAATASGSNTWRAAFIVLAGVALLSAALIYATSVRQTDPTTQLQADAGSLPVQPIGPASGTQEENLAKRPLMTDDEIKAAMNANTALTPDQLPGGDGYNPWSTGGPPLGAPPSYVPPGGQTMTLEPGNSSQFMPQELPPGCTMLPSGVVLCPKPVNPADAAKPTPTPNAPAGNTATGQPTPGPVATPKPLATPTTRGNRQPATNRPAKPEDLDLQ